MKPLRWLVAAGVLCSLFLATTPTSSQEVAERLLDDELPETEDVTSLLELLERLRTRPLDLNRATVEDLMQLPWVSPDVARKIVSWRKTHGPFIDIVQIEEVQGIASEVLERLRPYVTVVPQVEGGPGVSRRWWTPLRLDFRARARRRWQPDDAVALEQPRTLPYRTYQRAELAVGDVLQATALWEKDPGEERLNDFSSFSIRYLPREPIVIIVGNYQIEVGQGLVLWGPYRFGKGGDPVLPVQQTGRGLREYRAVDENSALSGVAASLSLPSISAIAFWSTARLDATLLQSGAVARLDRSGYHRGPSGEARKDAQEERLWGGRLVWFPTDWFRLGTTAYAARYARPFEPTDPRRDFFTFSGRKNRLVGIDATADGKRLTLSAEWARSHSGGWGTVATASVRVQGATVVALWRHFSPDFYNFRARAFIDAGPETRNERGVYLGVRVRSRPLGEVGLAFDQFQSLWRTATFPFPRRGEEFLLQWRRRLRRLALQVRIRHRRLGRPMSVPAAIGGSRRVVTDRTRRTWRLQLDYTPSNTLSLRSRVEVGRVRETLPGGKATAETAYLIYQQARWQPRKRWRIEARWTSFDSPSYDSRLYAYESDLPGVWSSVAFYGRGTRWYLLAMARLGPIRLGAKLAETVRLQAVQRGSQKSGVLSTRELGMYFEWAP
jgi:competence ComEA-like helix-hairpin-helix protein